MLFQNIYYSTSRINRSKSLFLFVATCTFDFFLTEFVTMLVNKEEKKICFLRYETISPFVVPY